MSKDMIFIEQHTKPDGTIVRSHWRKQKPAMSQSERNEKARDRDRKKLVEQAKEEQRAEGLLDDEQM